MDKWEEIIKEAISEGVKKKQGPVPGAAFRQMVDSAARKIGDGLPEVKFIDFIKKYDHIVSLILREGQDFLVVPHGKMDILDTLANGPTWIRQDMYEAFTLIHKDKKAYYSKAKKTVVWLSGALEQNEDLIPIPVRTHEDEVLLRGKFLKDAANSIEASKIEDLTKALSSEAPFFNFSQKLRSFNLMAKWLGVRSESILDRIREWAVANNIAWDESWIARQNERSVFGLSAISARTESAKALGNAFAKLPEDDLARISVPLDIVMKILNSVKQG